jgi:hypothetical protein
MFSKVKPLKGNICAQVFVAENFIRVHPMGTKSDAGRALQVLVEDVGVPNHIVVDGAKEQTGPNTDFMKTVCWLKMRIRNTEPYSPWQNRAENSIGLLKKRWKQTIARKNVHRRVWDYALVYDSEILSRTTRREGDRTGYEKITGETPDISEWLDFGFYDHVWYWDTPNEDIASSKIARWLGVSHRIGSGLCYWLLKENGQVLSKTTVQHITRLDLEVDDVKAKIKTYDDLLMVRLDDENFQLNPNDCNAFFILDDEDVTNAMVVPDEGNEQTVDVDNVLPEDDPTEEAYDTLLNAEVVLSEGSEQVMGTVTKRARGADGRPIGTRAQNPIADTQMYEVRLPDGSSRELTYNVIAENLFSQCDMC